MICRIDIKDFAIISGEPLFKTRLHVNKPTMPDKSSYDELVNQVFQSGIYTNDGPLVKKLEADIAEYLDVEHCVVSNNGTMALALLLISMGIKGEVIIPSFTFISTPHILKLFGIEPVFCDIEEGTFNIDARQCESLITEKTSAIIATHLWGKSCNVSLLSEIAEIKNIKLILDASHAFGCRYEDGYIGCGGDAEFYSFHATKFFHAFEGGCITTNDIELANQLKLIRNFGFVEYDKVIGLGLNAKMPEVVAAAGITNLKFLETLFEKSHCTYLHYKYCLKEIPGISLVNYDLEKSNCHYIVLTINEDEFGLCRDQLIKLLHRENVMARRYFYPGCHKMEPYCQDNHIKHQDFPITNDLTKNVILLPGGGAISKVEISQICQLIKDIYSCSILLRKLP